MGLLVIHDPNYFQTYSVLSLILSLFFIEYIPPATMIPEKRLEKLVDQALTLQKMNCIYHNTVENDCISLYTDHVCSKYAFFSYAHL